LTGNGTFMLYFFFQFNLFEGVCSNSTSSLEPESTVMSSTSTENFLDANDLKLPRGAGEKKKESEKSILLFIR
jgi:hypothetical protein